MDISKQQIEEVISGAQKLRVRINAMISHILINNGAKSEDTAIVFDYKNNESPSFFALGAGERGEDVWITRIWFDNDLGLVVDYVSAISNECYKEMCLAEESFADYESILSYLEDFV